VRQPSRLVTDRLGISSLCDKDVLASNYQFGDVYEWRSRN
jgi:hypothetical protein